jgi:hypothetical protein
MTLVRLPWREVAGRKSRRDPIGPPKYVSLSPSFLLACRRSVDVERCSLFPWERR